MVGPYVRIGIDADRAGIGAKFGAERVGIGFEREHGAACADNFVFVDGAFAELGGEEFTDSGRAARTQGIDAAIPVVEIANDADPFGAGSPDGEMHAADTFERFEMRAKLFVRVVVAAFAHEMKIKLAEKVGEGVGVEGFDRFAVGGAKANAIRGRGWGALLRVGEGDLKEARRAQPPGGG